ncbi:MAG: hypothetical protein M3Q69_03385 [Acidobacteriota bacterium]|nr:hypothetical protein [Acidobacteriota bacterium]
MVITTAIVAFLFATATPAALPVHLTGAPKTLVERDGIRYQIQRDASGRKNLLVSRVDGTKMTDCATWVAIVEHEFICSGTGQQCGSYINVATGSGSSEDDGEACVNAAANACDGVINAGCNYMYCTEITNVVYHYYGQSGNVCLYYDAGVCGNSLACQ